MMPTRGALAGAVIACIFGVVWTERSLMLSGLALGLRLLRRGEAEVL